jgi:uncharacterized protein (TIGR02996 family)
MRFHPNDDTARLVAADWLQDTDKPELVAWADFIRFQIEAARNRRDHVYTDSCDCGVCRPERRAAVLFDRWAMWWLGHSAPNVAAFPGYTRKVNALAHWKRGFIHEIGGAVRPYKIKTLPALVREFHQRANPATIELMLFAW